jgi:hypothetical protein
MYISGISPNPGNGPSQTYTITGNLSSMMLPCVIQFSDGMGNQNTLMVTVM